MTEPVQFDPTWATESQLLQARTLIQDTLEAANLGRDTSMSFEQLKVMHRNKQMIERELNRRGMVGPLPAGDLVVWLAPQSRT